LFASERLIVGSAGGSTVASAVPFDLDLRFRDMVVSFFWR
jgi:hypothetical protein